MEAMISKWGNSNALRLPASVVAQTGMQTGHKVTITVNADKSVTLKPVSSHTDKLNAMLSQITPDNLPDVNEFDALMGDEVW